MFRKTLKFFAVFSLLVAVTVCVLWIRGYFRLDEIECEWSSETDGHVLFRIIEIDSAAGGMQLRTSLWDIDAGQAQKLDPDVLRPRKFKYKSCHLGITHYQQPYKRLSDGFAGFGFRAHFYPDLAPLTSLKEWSASIPLWFFIVIFSTPGLIIFRHTLKARHRLRRGLCPACGYDMRESKDHCPECGQTTSLGAAP